MECLLDVYIFIMPVSERRNRDKSFGEFIEWFFFHGIFYDKFPGLAFSKNHICIYFIIISELFVSMSWLVEYRNTVDYPACVPKIL